MNPKRYYGVVDRREGNLFSLPAKPSFSPHGKKSQKEFDMKKQIVFCALLATAFFFSPGISHARMYNVNTGRFITMDTFEGDQQDPQSLHKYVYCANNPVNNIDPSGNDLESLTVGDALAGFDGFNFNFSSASTLQGGPETLYIRSFAPWKTFGYGFSGDNRSFTTTHVPGGVAKSAAGATSRITSIIKFNPDPLSIISQTAYSDPSHHPLLGTATGTPHVTATVSGFKMNIQMAGAVPLLHGLAPDIDVKLDMQVLGLASRTFYSGNLYGDAFPDAEVFIVNPSDKTKMLHTFTTSGDRNTGPMDFLPFDNNLPMGRFSTWVNN
jgi:hypothetical protein